MTQSEKDEMYIPDMSGYYDALVAERKNADRVNNRLFKTLERVKGKGWVKNLKGLLQDCEVAGRPYELCRARYGQYQNESYGRSIKGYWVDQWSIGDSGDSWEGYIYVEIRTNRYLKVFYSI